MTPENFCYWLKGWFELNQTIDHREGATKETLKMMEDHLDLVFKKVTPAPSLSEIMAKELKKRPEDTKYC